MGPVTWLFLLFRVGSHYELLEQADLAETHFPHKDLGNGEVIWTSLLCAEAFIGEGSEFMDNWEVQIESSENTVGAGAWRRSCGPEGLPESLGTLVPVP